MVKRPQTSQTAEKAVLFVEAILNEVNWVSNRLHQDFGIDLHVKVFEANGRRRGLPWDFFIQVKGTTKLRLSGDTIRLNVDKEHLLDWYDSRLPVLLVLCDVASDEGYWLWVKEYLDSIDYDWEEGKYIELHFPKDNQFTPDSLIERLRDIKRLAFLHEAANVIHFLETPSEEMVYDEPFWPHVDNPFRQSLEPPEESLNDLALARCILCESYFWIDEQSTEGCDRLLPGDDMPVNCMFTRIYSPQAHEPAVYSSESPEYSCPFCMTGRGALAQCVTCQEYRIPRGAEYFEWDDPLVTQDEAENHCAECLDELRRSRSEPR
ncbi:MAG TPA: DUF4365 domain-containing protein [Pyrinomonadaceae bacterium]|jgi:hypothetical protein|nr:DUF4365 domain-containing protein [Pyrinomonadaceae bacterium]